MYEKALKELGGNPTLLNAKTKPNLNYARPITDRASSSRANESDRSDNTPDWQVPKNPIKHPNRQGAPSPVTNSNTFDPLASTQADDNSMETETDDNGNTNRQSDKTRQQAHPKGKPPPIHIQGQKITTTIAALTTAKIGKTAFKIKQNDDEFSTITTESYQAFNNISEILKSHNTHFFTYTPKHQKQKTLVLKGIKGDFKEEDVAIEIADLEIPNCTVIKVTKFIYNSEYPDRYHYLVQFTNNTILAEVFKINTLLYQTARWEHLKKKKIFQCRRCQRVGHASINCFLPFRCVRCALSHEPGQCAIPADAGKDKLKCANCKQSGHPASYGGCPFLKFVANANKQQQTTDNPPKQNQPGPRTFNSQPVNDNISFAQALHTPRPSPQNIPTSSDRTNDEHPNAHAPFHQPPQQSTSWTNDFKSEISSLISSQIALQISLQFSKITELISENAKRIDILFSTYTRTKYIKTQWTQHRPHQQNSKSRLSTSIH